MISHVELIPQNVFIVCLFGCY